MALAWVLAKGSFIVPVVGARTRAQLAESLGALEVKLTAEEISALEAAVPADAGREPAMFRRRAHDGRRREPDADGQDFDGSRAARRRARALHLRAHRSHDGWRHSQLRHAGRSEHRRARRAHRLCRPPRHRADNSAKAAGRIPAIGISSRKGISRCRRPPQGDEGLHHPRPRIPETRGAARSGELAS